MVAAYRSGLADVVVADWDVARDYDPDGDASYLEQDGWEARLAEYRAGDFWLETVGAFVGLECVVPAGDAAPAGLDWEFLGRSSDGLRDTYLATLQRWVGSVESDSGIAYFAELETKLLGDIVDELSGLSYIPAAELDQVRQSIAWRRRTLGIDAE